jgi:hypothetical protein
MEDAANLSVPLAFGDAVAAGPSLLKALGGHSGGSSSWTMDLRLSFGDRIGGEAGSDPPKQCCG